MEVKRRPLDRRKEFHDSNHNNDINNNESSSTTGDYNLYDEEDQQHETLLHQRLLPLPSSPPHSPLKSRATVTAMNLHQDLAKVDMFRHQQRRRHQKHLPSYIWLKTNQLSSILWNNVSSYTSLSYSNMLYLPNTPIECQIYRIENIAIPFGYLLVGILQGLSLPLLNVLPIDILHANEAQQKTIMSIQNIPASLKLVFGFISDTIPLYNHYRRKPYMLFGWLLTSISFILLLVFSNIHHIPISNNGGCFHNNVYSNNIVVRDLLQQDVNSNNNDIHNNEINPLILPNDVPSIPFFSLCILLFGIGYWFADVICDSVVAERAKLELPEHRGIIQSTCYAYRFFGKMIAAPIATYIYSMYGPYYICILLCIIPLCILPFVYTFHEKPYYHHNHHTNNNNTHDHDDHHISNQNNTNPNGTTSAISYHCTEIWNTVCSRAVWQPMGFIYLYNILQVGNAAWKEYLVSVLHFTSCQLNLLLITSYILLYLGIIAYKRYFMKWSWRKVYIATTILNSIFSIIQVLLIKGITFGISPFWFTIGDDAIVEFISGIQFLPTTIMMVNLCPDGSEGASYAMFTTVNNSALTLSSLLSTQLLRIWDVSKSTLLLGNINGMIKLTYFTTFIQVSGILFIGLLPQYKDDLLKLKSNQYTSKIGGIIFLIITFGSILYSIIICLLNILYPGWNGES